MEKQVLKTTITIEFAADESIVAADVLAIVASARNAGFAQSIGRQPRPEAPAQGETPADETPEKVEDKPKRPRPSRAKAKSAPVEEPADEPEDEPEDAQDEDRTPRNTDVTHDDVRELMADVIEEDDANRGKVLKQLQKIGAKSVGQIADEDLADFYGFLQKLKD